MEELELAGFKEWLLKEKDRLVSEIAYVESTMEQSQSEWSGENEYESHMADSATSTFARESDLSLSINSRDMLSRVDGALSRIEDGSFGICSVCGRPIERERLEALPYADLCMEDKIKEEKS
ncbi:MAG: TraR/DksA C4-type zinc finger protein [Candidatus Aquicultor sp.]|nr:TraR/DksA C4-type zinc finger protein [Candidatus Aquicultor sp.]